MFVSPVELRAGHIGTLTCKTDSCNPAPNVTWWRTASDGRLRARLVTFPATETLIAGEHGGSVLISRVDVALKADDDRSTVACLANGTRTAVSRVQLRVRCKLLLLVRFFLAYMYSRSFSV